ncbi:hypothetical protein [Methanobrevibacter sp. AbM4]|nr:hypothetical protein [Methanobrevibacter sp. AbM4]
MAGWTIRKLLEKNYVVQTTVRSLEKSEKVITMLNNEGGGYCKPII